MSTCPHCGPDSAPDDVGCVGPKKTVDGVRLTPVGQRVVGAYGLEP